MIKKAIVFYLNFFLMISQPVLAIDWWQDSSSARDYTGCRLDQKPKDIDDISFNEAEQIYQTTAGNQCGNVKRTGYEIGGFWLIPLGSS